MKMIHHCFAGSRDAHSREDPLHAEVVPRGQRAAAEERTPERHVGGHGQGFEPGNDRLG